MVFRKKNPRLQILLCAVQVLFIIILWDVGMKKLAETLFSSTSEECLYNIYRDSFA